MKIQIFTIILMFYRVLSGCIEYDFPVDKSECRNYIRRGCKGIKSYDKRTCNRLKNIGCGVYWMINRCYQKGKCNFYDMKLCKKSIKIGSNCFIYLKPDDINPNTGTNEFCFNKYDFIKRTRHPSRQPSTYTIAPTTFPTLDFKTAYPTKSPTFSPEAKNKEYEPGYELYEVGK